jgi:hypothetical protein
MLVLYADSKNGKIISEKGAFLWWLKRDVNVENESETKQNKNMHYKPNIIQKVPKGKHTANE